MLFTCFLSDVHVILVMRDPIEVDMREDPRCPWTYTPMWSPYVGMTGCSELQRDETPVRIHIIPPKGDENCTGSCMPLFLSLLIKGDGFIWWGGFWNWKRIWMVKMRAFWLTQTMPANCVWTFRQISIPVWLLAFGRLENLLNCCRADQHLSPPTVLSLRK